MLFWKGAVRSIAVRPSKGTPRGLKLTSFDLVVIGSGPAGQKAAIAAAKIRKRVAVVDRQTTLGGVSVHNGTIPSKTFREGVLYLTGFRERTFYGRSYSLKERISAQDLSFRVRAVVAKEIEIIRAQLMRNDVVLLDGSARFVDPHTLEIQGIGAPTTVRAPNIVIACGTRPSHNPEIQLDGKYVLDTDQMVSYGEIPKEAIIVGGGVIGLEYTSMLAALGVKVTLVEQRPVVLDFVDREIVEALCYHLRDLGTTFRLGEKVVSVTVDDTRKRVVARLESGKSVSGSLLLYCVGREGNTDTLNLAAAGLTSGVRGKLEVNEFFQTAVPHIYAVGISWVSPRWRALPPSKGARRAATSTACRSSIRRSFCRTASTRFRKFRWWEKRRGIDLRQNSLRNRSGALRRIGQRANDRRRDRNVEIAVRSGDAETSGSPRDRRPRRGDHSHRASGAGARGHYGISAGHGLQLSYDGRSV
jgi:NADPH-dependent 2,4-dienoyl-CoA reductase/sulfur reductase-like enzyme